MKQDTAFFEVRFNEDLYPTRFRWNYEFFYALTCCLYIYIPHGSDETKSRFFLCADNFVFISHTVQMKPEITTPNII